MNISVECKSRPEGTKPRALRREGLIPAALYGHDGANSISLTIPAKQAQMLLREAAVNNTLIDLKVPSEEIMLAGSALHVSHIRVLTPETGLPLQSYQR